MASVASEFEFDLTFEMSNFYYLGMGMLVAFNLHICGLRVQSGLQTASEVIYDLRIEVSDLNYLCCHASLASKCHYFMIVIERRRRRRRRRPIMIH